MLWKIFLLSLFFSSIFGSHFRGGTFNWQVNQAPDATYDLTIDYRLAWRNSAGSNFFCNEQIKNNGTLLIGEGVMACLSGCVGNIGAMRLRCTDFSPQSKEDWMSGVNSLSQKVTPGLTQRVVGFRGNAWIPLVVGGSSAWSMITKINLAIRSDTGKINFSPRTAMAPILRLEYGCTYKIRIPVADVDNDVVRCRWAQRGSVDECGSVCNTFPGAVLDSSKCEMEYIANRTLGWYGVAIQIEDFQPSDATFQTPLSSIPLQFLVLVQKTGSACPTANTSPQFRSPPTPADDSVFYIVAGNVFQFQVVTQTASSSSSIVDVETVSPAGTNKDPIASIGNNTYSMSIAFTPQVSQAGPNILCFTAVENTGQRTNQYCITINVAAEPVTTVPPTPASATCADIDCPNNQNGNYKDPFNNCATHFFKCSNGYCYRYECPIDIDGTQLVYYDVKLQCERRNEVPGC